MRKNTVWIVAILAVAAGGIAMAQGGEGRFGAHAFKRLDTDRDGRITEAEARGALKAHFSFLDDDGDGAVTRTELRDARERRREMRSAKRFDRLDGNGDGRIDRGEFEAHATDRFARADQNGDGAITIEEARAVRWRQAD